MRKFIKGSGILTWMTSVLLITAVVSTAAAQAPVDNPLRSYADVAEITMPAVVNISTDKMVDNGAQQPFMDDPAFRRFFNMPDDDVHNNPEQMERSLGSGIVISSDGYILTNEHVIRDADELTVKLLNGEEYDATVVGTDSRTDLAVLRIDGQNLVAARFGNSDEIEVGEWVLAIGNPYRLARTVTAGIVSAKDRPGVVGELAHEGFLQTDAAVNPGNSGGPLVNMRGQVVGINVAIFGTSYQGISFAIPSNRVRKVYEELRTTGKVIPRGYLGVRMVDVTEHSADELGLKEVSGALVAGVEPGAPAQPRHCEARARPRQEKMAPHAGGHRHRH